MATYTASTIVRTVGLIGTKKREFSQRVVLRDGELYTNFASGVTPEEELAMLAQLNAPSATDDELEQYE